MIPETRTVKEAEIVQRPGPGEVKSNFVIGLLARSTSKGFSSDLDAVACFRCFARQ
jgi:hypothetical protein